jgi:hypothetical protein
VNSLPRRYVSDNETKGILLAIFLIAFFGLMALYLSGQQLPTLMQSQLFSFALDMIKILMGGLAGFLFGKRIR